MNSKVRTKRGSRRRGVKGRGCTRRGKGLSTVRRCTRRTRRRGVGRTVRRQRGGGWREWGQSMNPSMNPKYDITKAYCRKRIKGVPKYWPFYKPPNFGFTFTTIKLGFIKHPYIDDIPIWWIVQINRQDLKKSVGYPVKMCTINEETKSIKSTSIDQYNTWLKCRSHWEEFKTTFEECRQEDEDERAARVQAAIVKAAIAEASAEVPVHSPLYDLSTRRNRIAILRQEFNKICTHQDKYIVSSKDFIEGLRECYRLFGYNTLNDLGLIRKTDDAQQFTTDERYRYLDNFCTEINKYLDNQMYDINRTNE